MLRFLRKSQRRLLLVGRFSIHISSWVMKMEWFHSGIGRYPPHEIVVLTGKSGQMIKSVQGHQKGMVVTDLQFSPDKTYFITASKDKSAKVTYPLILRLTGRSGMQIPLTFSKLTSPTHPSTQLQ